MDLSKIDWDTVDPNLSDENDKTFLSEAVEEEPFGAVKLIAKENNWSYRSHSRYHSYEIKVKDVRLVGPEVSKQCK